MHTAQHAFLFLFAHYSASRIYIPPARARAYAPRRTSGGRILPAPADLHDASDESGTRHVRHYVMAPTCWRLAAGGNVLRRVLRAASRVLHPSRIRRSGRW